MGERERERQRLMKMLRKSLGEEEGERGRFTSGERGGGRGRGGKTGKVGVKRVLGFSSASLTPVREQEAITHRGTF